MDEYRNYIREQLEQSPQGLVTAPKKGKWKTFPDIIVFDPLQDLKVEVLCPANSDHGLLRRTETFADFGKRNPRLIYGLKRNAWLVSQLLKCSKCPGFFLSHEKSILSQLPGDEVVQFLLFHKGGVFRDLFNLIITMITKGKDIKKNIFD